LVKDSEIIAYEIDTLIRNAADSGRDHLNDEEAQHIINMSERLVLKYVRELQDLYND
jgi:hypothetical protein